MGCDDYITICSIDNGYFNPRTHVGCDCQHRDSRVGLRISIHAPTWGATGASILTSSFFVFQSTHPRGVRPITKVGKRRVSNFNPRTHVGCDSAVGFRSCASYISIHAPTWGATVTRFKKDSTSEFQSTHPRGVRLVFYCSMLAQMAFQSTHPRGVRPWNQSKHA